MKKNQKKIPTFKSEDEERGFWASHSPLDYFEKKKVKRAVFHNLKPSIKTISLRLPEDMLQSLKLLANKHDLPYQSLAKIFLAHQIKREMQVKLP